MSQPSDFHGLPAHLPTPALLGRYFPSLGTSVPAYRPQLQGAWRSFTQTHTLGHMEPRPRLGSEFCKWFKAERVTEPVSPSQRSPVSSSLAGFWLFLLARGEKNRSQVPPAAAPGLALPGLPAIFTGVSLLSGEDVGEWPLTR